jgi:hypothetical protein
VRLGLAIPSDHVSAFLQLYIKIVFDATSCEKDRCLQHVTRCVTENLYIYVRGAYKMVKEASRLSRAGWDPGIQSISQISRPCSEHVFSESISCLRSGSPSQLFVAAASCTSLSLYSRPERKRADYTPETEVLGFRHLGRPRLPKFVEKFHKLGQSVNGPNFVQETRWAYFSPTAPFGRFHRASRSQAKGPIFCSHL